MALIGLCGTSLLLNVLLVAHLSSGPSDAAVVVVEPPRAETAVAAIGGLAPQPAAPVAPVLTPPDGMQMLGAPLEHSLARTFRNMVDDDERADMLSATYTRLFVWDLDVARDLRANDDVRLLYSWDSQQPEIHAASFSSQKLGTSFDAFRHHRSGDTYPSWWHANGDEVSLRLSESPLHEYEQITSRLKDRPNHKGMDFKVPTGVDVVSPRSGEVVRVNWNFRFNGNCAEVRYDDGSLARFLHLSRTDVEAGQRVAAGAVLGLSGNTGRSTNPHLHYEIEKNGKIIDPMEYHGTYRRSLSDAEKIEFDVARQRLEPLLAAMP